MGIHLTKEGFVWHDVTSKIKYQLDWFDMKDYDQRKGFQDAWKCFELYAIHEDDTESLLETVDEIEEAVKLGLRIGIEVGHLPKEEKPKWWSDADKKIIDGHWWVKISDVKFG